MQRPCENTLFKNMVSQKSVKTIAITSAKGGVGKSQIATNLAVSLAQKKNKVLLVDAHFGLANIEYIINIKKKFSLCQVLKGVCDLEKTIVRGPHGISVIPGSSSILSFSLQEYAGLIDVFNELSEHFDYVIIDTPTGFSEGSISFCRSAEELILILTEEPSSIENSVELMKTFYQCARIKQLHLLVNMSRNRSSKSKLMNEFFLVSDLYYDMNINYLGEIPFDECVYKAAMARQSFVSAFPYTVASKSMRTIAKTVNNWPLKNSTGNTRFFHERFIEG